MKKTREGKKKATKKRLPKPDVTDRNSVKVLTFDNLTSAWAGVNEYLLREESEVWARGGGIYGPEFVSYNNYVIVKDCRMDPDFDFGTILGYSDKKWASLKNNYLDLDYLDLVKSEVNSRQGKNAKSYNYSYHFKNYHGSGKDCLISLVFTKRIDNPIPIVVFNVRVSEVTKRLPFDFLLIQRMVEYVYGYEQKVELHMFAPSFYIAAEAVLMYTNYRSIRKVLKKQREEGTLGRFQSKVLKTLKEFLKPEALNMTFKTFLRTAEQIQKDENGRPVSGVIPMYARELQLFKNLQPYPADMVSPKERANYRKIEGINKRKPRKKRRRA
jgi:hypothetical protein